ncbi:MAG: AI-2E family transporter YdiK [Polymorphobacter sp.]
MPHQPDPDTVPPATRRSFRDDLPRATLVVLFICGLLAAVFWVLRPFIGSAIWATLIVVAAWPLMLRLQKWFGGRRWAAVATMLIALLMLFMLPVLVVGLTIVQNATDIMTAVEHAPELATPTAPAWIAGLPLVGSRIAALWQQTVAGGAEGVWATVEPYSGRVSSWFVGQLGSAGLVLAHGALVLLLTALLFSKGELAAAQVRRVFRRLGGAHGETMLTIAGQAIRGVALGVGLTAVIQSTLAGISLTVAGAPFAGLLTMAIFLCYLGQIGSLPVMIPTIIWMYWSGNFGWATFLVVATAIIASLDNILSPLLIRKGVDLPLLVIISGVIGGLIAYGLVGIFIGPVVLAVAYTLLNAWVAEMEQG